MGWQEWFREYWVAVVVAGVAIGASIVLSVWAHMRNPKTGELDRRLKQDPAMRALLVLPKRERRVEDCDRLANAYLAAGDDLPFEARGRRAVVHLREAVEKAEDGQGLRWERMGELHEQIATERGGALDWLEAKRAWRNAGKAATTEEARQRCRAREDRAEEEERRAARSGDSAYVPLD